MGNLPLERLKPSTPFSFVMLDLFGPFPIRCEVQKRTTGKASGNIFTDLVSRSVHIEASFAYDTATLLHASASTIQHQGLAYQNLLKSGLTVSSYQ